YNNSFSLGVLARPLHKAGSACVWQSETQRPEPEIHCMGTAVSLFRPARKTGGSEYLKRGDGISEVAVEPLPVPFSDASLTLVETDQVLPRERSERLSRALNIVVAVVALVFAAPIMLLVALAVRLTSKGPVLYSQVRVGVDRRFRFARTYDRRGYDHG